MAAFRLFVTMSGLLLAFFAAYLEAVSSHSLLEPSLLCSRRECLPVHRIDSPRDYRRCPARGRGSLARYRLLDCVYCVPPSYRRPPGCSETATAYVNFWRANTLWQAFGRKPIMFGGLVIFTTGSVLAGAAQTMPWLVGARCMHPRMESEPAR